MNGFYWIYILIFALLMCWHFGGKVQTREKIYWIALGSLILLFALQDTRASTDVKEYMYQYSLIPELSFGQMLTHKFEIGYVLLNRLLAALFESDRILILVMGILILVPFGICFVRETEEPMMAVMSFLAVGMYIHSIIYWRQLCAMGILLCSFRFIRERKLWKFLLMVLLAMSFHKASAVFIVMYLAYVVSVNKWLMLGAGLVSVAFAVLGEPVVRFITRFIYKYEEFYFVPDGGLTMTVVLWAFTLLVYWLMQDRLEEDRIKIPFMMILIAATLQPVCLAFYNWLRIVLFFRVAMVLLIPELYVTVFTRRENNRLLSLLEKTMPPIHSAVLKIYDKKWFRAAVQIAMFAVLFLWYADELDGAVYFLTPVF